MCTTFLQSKLNRTFIIFELFFFQFLDEMWQMDSTWCQSFESFSNFEDLFEFFLDSKPQTTHARIFQLTILLIFGTTFYA